MLHSDFFSVSGLNLTLKTPFVKKHTERAGLQRKVSNRRLPSVDAFDEAVQRCLEQGPNQGLHKLSLKFGIHPRLSVSKIVSLPFRSLCISGWKNSRRFFVAEVHTWPQ